MVQGWVRVAVLGSLLLFQASAALSDNRPAGTSTPGVQEPAAKPGRISGIVGRQDTGDPVAGAYVGVGDFGDSGGSNYSRHREEGLYATGKTDNAGCFALDGLALRDAHPLIVTHPDFVRADQSVSLSSAQPAAEIRVALRPSASIKAVVVDAAGRPAPGVYFLRLEALDGREFIPPGRDPHLSSFASSVWLAEYAGETFSFTELDAGEYALDAIRVELAASQPRRMLDTKGVAYHGGVSSVTVKNRETREVRISPEAHGTRVTGNVPEVHPAWKEFAHLVVISRNPGLLVWEDGTVHGPEDPRLGRIQKSALFWAFASSDTFSVANLPPGTYSVLAGPFCFLEGARITLSQGQECVVNLPKTEPQRLERSDFRWTLRSRITPPGNERSVEELCRFLSQKTNGQPRFECDASVAGKRIVLPSREMSMWELVERLCSDARLVVTVGPADEDKRPDTLILRPAGQPDGSVAP